MSRPFSYNDENFTVIGSLLIIHIAFSGRLVRNGFICVVPPEINKRIKYKGFVGYYYMNPYNALNDIGLFVQGEKLLVSRPGEYTNGEFFCYCPLRRYLRS